MVSTRNPRYRKLKIISFEDINPLCNHHSYKPGHITGCLELYEEGEVEHINGAWLEMIVNYMGQAPLICVTESSEISCDTTY